MDILDNNIQQTKKFRDEYSKVNEDNVAVQTALAKAKQVDEMEKLKAQHIKEIEALQAEHERENERLAGAKEKEVIDTQIKKQREAERKAAEKSNTSESVELDEERMSIATQLFKSYKKDIEKLMKKHDAYVSDTGLKFTFISSPKPMKNGFMKDLLKLLGMSESVEEGKLVADTHTIIDTIIKKIQLKLEKEVQKNKEKGLALVNELGKVIGHKVTDKSQEKGKLFLKFETELDEAKYTNIHNKIKNIRNLKRKESEFIANIDPAVMGQVVKALAPMFEETMPGKGNASDDGVCEIGTDDIRQKYQADTPGQAEEGYVKEQEKAFHEQKSKVKKNFKDVFQNPLKGYPANEDFEVKKL